MLMLNVDVRSHRPYLRASAGAQKLFLMLKLLPSPEAADARPDVSIAVVVDLLRTRTFHSGCHAAASFGSVGLGGYTMCDSGP